MTPTFVLAIMAKAPRPSAVKTRLCPPLSPGVAKISQPFDNF
ncbi:MAG TPA: hypothetical protein VN977_09615 [Candidatus Binatia bacterium]|jgi:glycosyltransferase A (GT-A) superfamily protein (DUF2064 family)|nr:hypothetical protein [Candidatus Binatia bacterium]